MNDPAAEQRGINRTIHNRPKERGIKPLSASRRIKTTLQNSKKGYYLSILPSGSRFGASGTTLIELHHLQIPPHPPFTKGGNLNLTPFLKGDSEAVLQPRFTEAD